MAVPPFTSKIKLSFYAFIVTAKAEIYIKTMLSFILFYPYPGTFNLQDFPPFSHQNVIALFKLTDGFYHKFVCHINTPFYCCFDTRVTQKLLQDFWLYAAFDSTYSVGMSQNEDSGTRFARRKQDFFILPDS